MRMRARHWVIGVLTLALGVPGIGWSEDPPPDEGMILLEEIPHIAERSILYSLPPDPESALEALSTLPDGLNDVIAMHLGRIYPTPHESTPGVAPLPLLLGARADLLLNPQHWDKKLRDTMSGEFSILLLPMDATTVIVIMPTQVVESDPNATPLPERRAHQHAGVSCDDRLNQHVVARQRAAGLVRQALPQPSAALDVREEKGDDPAR